MGIICAFCLDFPLLEYVPTIPPHSTTSFFCYYDKGKIIGVYNNKDDYCCNTICILSENTYFMFRHNFAPNILKTKMFVKKMTENTYCT